MKFFILLMILASCKAYVRKTEASEPDFVKSKDGTMLTLTLDKEVKFPESCNHLRNR